MEVLAAYPCLCVADVPSSVAFHRSLLGLEVTADVGWYAELSASSRIVVAFVQQDHDSVPLVHERAIGGVLLSVVVDDVVTIAARAEELGAPIAQPLRDEEFGQRHLMVVAPGGHLVDIIERIPMTPAFRRQLVAGRRAWR